MNLTRKSTALWAKSVELQFDASPQKSASFPSFENVSFGVLASEPAASWLAPSGGAEILVRFQVGPGGLLESAGLQKALSAVGARSVEFIGDAYQAADGKGSVQLLKVTIDPGLASSTAIAVLARQAGVDLAEPNWWVTAQGVPDPSVVNGGLWGMYSDQPYGDLPSSAVNRYGSQAADAWADGLTGSSKAVIGVIDEGIDYTHPDLYLNIWLNQREIPLALRSGLIDSDGDKLIGFRDLNHSSNAAFVRDFNNNQRIDAGDLLADPRWEDGVDTDGNGYIDDLVGWDFFNGDNNPFDPVDGDNHGTHVAGTIGGVGENGIGVAGVNWNVRMMPLKFLGPNGGSIGGAIQAVDYFNAAADNADPTAGELFVGTNNSWGGGGYSASMRDALLRAADRDLLFIAAAGNDNANNDATPSYPSGYSTLGGGRPEIVIAVASIDSSGARSGFSSYGALSVDLAAPGSDVLSTVAGGGYARYSGTSMATPHVAGAAALYASANPGATAAQIRQALIDAAVPTASLQGLVATGGRLDLSGMLVGTVGFSDDAPPAVAYAVSAFNSLTAPAAADLMVYFEERVAPGPGGEIVLSKDAGGTDVVARFNVNAPDPALQFDGATLSIDLASSLVGGTRYYLSFGAGSIKDLANNPLVSPVTVNFIADDFAGKSSTTGRANAGATVDGTIETGGDTDWFGVDLQAGVRYTFWLDPNGSTRMPDPFLSLYGPSLARLAFNDDTASGVLSSRLDYTPSTSGTYYLEARDYSAAVTGGYRLTVSLPTDVTAPRVSSFSPADGATGIALETDVTLVFSEAIRLGAGSIQLRSGSSTGTVVESFDAASSSRLSVSGATLVVDPTNKLLANTTYFVTFPSGSIRDLAGNAYAGTTAYDFRTGLVGTESNDTLTGGTAADVIRGLGGNDLITGAAANDRMDGGEGSDVYIIAANSHRTAAEITDTGLTGTDEIRFTATSSSSSTKTLTLYAAETGLERAVIGTGTGSQAVTTGTTALDINAAAVGNPLEMIGNNGANLLTGTAFNDRLVGNGGNDTLNSGDGADTLLGGLGNDTLRGGPGADIFVFNTTPNSSSNRDALPDFLGGVDTLQFSKAIFRGLAANDLGDIASAQFVSGVLTAATNASHRFIYNTSSGVLYYDADGTGSTAAVQVAILGISGARPSVSGSDIEVIA